MSDPENMDTIERPKKKRVASEKQRAHLAKIQPKATEAKKKNKEIVQTVKKYEAVKKPIHDYTAMQHDLSLIKQYLTKEEARKIEKRRTKEIVDKAQVREMAYDSELLFR
jgi:hypothetical protein